ncbi:hypothetical protein [Allohahella sp. A8]|uniref:hypothetical protein n=1 Tax=Allohahella sp. A8 TaxID=3141461 RepID=UPI003A8118AE
MIIFLAFPLISLLELRPHLIARMLRMIRIAAILFSLLISASVLAAEPKFDASTNDSHMKSLYAIGKIASKADGQRLQKILIAYGMGEFVATDGPVYTYNGQHSEELFQKAYLYSLSQLNGLTMQEIFAKYEADKKAAK